MKWLRLNWRSVLILILLGGTGFLVHRAITWRDIYNRCMDSPWQAVHPDNLQPITLENIDQLQEAEVFDDVPARVVLFDPTGQCLITDTGLDRSFYYSAVTITNLRISCENHDMLLEAGWPDLIRSGYRIPGCLQGISPDGEWVVVEGCGSITGYGTIHKIQLPSGQDNVISEGEFERWLAEDNLNLVMDNPEGNSHNVNHSLVVEVIHDRIDRVGVRETATGELIRELAPYDRNPCDHCRSDLCGVSVSEVFFSPDSKYLVASIAPYCDVPVFRLRVWVVPSSTGTGSDSG